MSLEAQIMDKMKAAMKAKDQVSLASLRAIKSAIQMAKTEAPGTELSSDDELAILTKLQKQRKDSIEVYEKEGRTDLAEEERAQIAIIEEFLPAQLSDEELEAELKSIIAQTGAESAKDIGKVMGMASGKLKGRADGKRIAAAAKGLLA
jgi:uncharacterized protein YqeY